MASILHLHVASRPRGTLSALHARNIYEKYFREWGDDHEIHENIPRKFEAIRSY